MSGTILVDPFRQFFDNNGDPLSLGTVQTFAAGTSTPLPTYSDVDLTTANPTTITLNTAGRPAVSGVIVALFAQAKAYKIVLKSSAGVTIDTQDNIVAYQGASGTNTDIEGTFGETVTAGQVVYLSDGSGSLNAGQWYKADADLDYASTDALIGFAVVGVTSGAAGQIRMLGALDGLAGLTAGLSYYVSGTAGSITSTPPTLRRFVGVAMSITELLIVPSPPAPVATFPVSVCEGRLTLTTALPVTTADVTGATSIFYAPYKGNRITLFDGTNWSTRTFSEITVPLGTLTSGLLYDLFAYDNNGAVAVDPPVAWTNGTTRATALARQDGVLSKSGALTRRYLGTFYTTSTTQTEDSFANRLVWNFYNRVRRPMRVIEATDSWTYSTATWRQARATATNQVGFVVGVAEDAFEAHVRGYSVNTNSGIARAVAVGLDSTTAPTAGNIGMALAVDSTPANQFGLSMSELVVIPAAGYHYAAWLEYSVATPTTTWYGDSGGTILQSGLSAMGMA